MARAVLSPGLDVEIANKIARPFVARVLDMLQDEARRGAPSTNVWITARDERVRASHREADAQVVPSNLRFKIPKVATGDDVNDIRAGFDLARYPRDPDLPVGNRINCRCEAPPLPELLRQSIHRGDVHVEGSRVSGTVETRFPRAAESEFGTSDDDGAYYMTNALREVAARLRASHTR